MWLLPVCSTAIYASMLTKAWRIYRIFDTSPKMKKVVIKDCHLVAYIAIMCGVDICLLAFWTGFDMIELRPRYIYESLSTLAYVVVPFSTVHAAANNSDLSNQTDNMLNQLPIVQNTTHTTKLQIIFECNSNLNEVSLFFNHFVNDFNN